MRSGSLKEVAERLEIDYGPLQQYQWVSGRYGSSTRADSLSHWHHMIAASREDGLEWLGHGPGAFLSSCLAVLSGSRSSTLLLAIAPIRSMASAWIVLLLSAVSCASASASASSARVSFPHLYPCRFLICVLKSSIRKSTVSLMSLPRAGAISAIYTLLDRKGSRYSKRSPSWVSKKPRASSAICRSAASVLRRRAKVLIPSAQFRTSSLRLSARSLRRSLCAFHSVTIATAAMMKVPTILPRLNHSGQFQLGTMLTSIGDMAQIIPRGKTRQKVGKA